MARTATPTPAPAQEFMLPAEAAELLRTSVRSIQRLCAAGELPGGLRVGGEYRIRRADLLAAIAAAVDPASIAAQDADDERILAHDRAQREAAAVLEADYATMFQTPHVDADAARRFADALIKRRPELRYRIEQVEFAGMPLYRAPSATTRPGARTSSELF